MKCKQPHPGLFPNDATKSVLIKINIYTNFVNLFLSHFLLFKVYGPIYEQEIKLCENWGWKKRSDYTISLWKGGGLTSVNDVIHYQTTPPNLNRSQTHPTDKPSWIGLATYFHGFTANHLHILKFIDKQTLDIKIQNMANKFKC